MKQLTCEMCGSTDLVKQDGFFICQTCGTKYSVEEAKKMMIEGTVEVKGTVKVDASAEGNNFEKLAQRAFENEKWDDVKKYSEKTLEIDSDRIIVEVYLNIANFYLEVEKSGKSMGQFLCGEQEYNPSLSAVHYFDRLKDVFNKNLLLRIARLDSVTESNKLYEVLLSFAKMWTQSLVVCWVTTKMSFDSTLLRCVNDLLVFAPEGRNLENDFNAILSSLRHVRIHRKTIEEVDKVFQEFDDDLLCSCANDVNDIDEELYPTISRKLFWLLKLYCYENKIQNNDNDINQELFAEEYLKLKNIEDNSSSSPRPKELEIIYSIGEEQLRKDMEAVCLSKQSTVDYKEKILKNALAGLEQNITLLERQIACANKIIEFDADLTKLNDLDKYVYVQNRGQAKYTCDVSRLNKRLTETKDVIIPVIRDFLKRQQAEKQKIEIISDVNKSTSFTVTSDSNKNGGCYVATCVYGSYDCPQVWTLRRYRDNTLGSTWYGRAFIRLYYAVSPTLVKWFGETKWFKKMWKGKLDRMVNKLQSKGVKNTPYEDKDWTK